MKSRRGELDRDKAHGGCEWNAFLDVITHELGVGGRGLPRRRRPGDRDGVGEARRREPAQPSGGGRSRLPAPEPAVECVQRPDIACRSDANTNLVANGDGRERAFRVRADGFGRGEYGWNYRRARMTGGGAVAIVEIEH